MCYLPDIFVVVVDLVEFSFHRALCDRKVIISRMLKIVESLRFK